MMKMTMMVMMVTMLVLVFMSCNKKKGVVETKGKKPNNQRDQKKIKGQYSKQSWMNQGTILGR